MEAPSQPRLPLELERAIFEMAARGSRKKVLPVLLLVAHRVRVWLQPIIYEVVALRVPEFAPYPRAHCPHFPSNHELRHVKHLLIAARPSDSPSGDEEGRRETSRIHINWQDIIGQCPNLIELAIWCITPYNTLAHLASILHSPIRTVSTGILRLSVSLEELFPKGQVNFNHEALKNLTHLEILDEGSEVAQWQGIESNDFSSLQALRYLAFHNYALDVSGVYVPVEAVKHCLQKCEQLEVLVIGRIWDIEGFFRSLPQVRRMRKRAQPPNGRGGNDVVEIEVPEDRVVINPSPGVGDWLDDWIRGAEGGTDFWIRAEEIVERRRRRKGLVRTAAWDTIWDEDMDLGGWFEALESQTPRLGSRDSRSMREDL